MAVGAVGIELAIVFIGATLPTPLYPLYQRAFGFSGVVLTLIYAAYVVGNLAALLILGRLSDQVGRRSVTLSAIGLAIVSALLFALAEAAAWLFAARIVSGLATGLAAGTATAWLAEMPASGGKAGTAQIASIANFIGLAVGPPIAGLLAQFAAWPLRLSYWIYLVMLLAVGVAICLAPETVENPRRRLRDLSLAPRLGVPEGIRLPFVPPAVTGFVIFAMIGFYAALIPNLLSESLHQSSPAVSGGVVCELFVVAAVFVLLTRNVGSRTAMLSALALLPPSLWLLIAAQFLGSMPLLLATTALSGIAAGLGYRGSLEVVNGIAPPEQRSEVVSSYLVALYLGNSLPVIGIGLLKAAAGSGAAHIAFAAVITILAGIAGVTAIKLGRKVA